RSVSAATTTAATASAGGGLTEARLRLGSVRREDGELLLYLRAAAGGTRRLLAVPDELLEVRLALPADVLVDRHSSKASAGSVDIGSWGSDSGSAWRGGSWYSSR